MTVLLLAAVLPWMLIGFGCWFCYQLVRQNGRILLRLEALEQRLQAQDAEPPSPTPAPPSGLPVGSIAPEFELPDLAGIRHHLSDFQGRSVLLIFFNPNCGFCTAMASDLAALVPPGGDGQPVPLVVTTGDGQANRQLFQKHEIRCPVLLQKDMEVASQYQAHGTPMGYLIDEKGTIASSLATGAPALLALASAGSATAEEPKAQQKPKAKGNKPLAESRLNRNGLKAGTPAPNFRLARLDGGDLALDEYRGRRVLLVFSDPDCGPCDQLAPQLERLHRERRDLQVLMVSRQDVETNRQKVAKLGLTFPVVLQQSWEASLLYAMFGTPIGYLIDEQGIIAADVAVGVEPILALAARPSVSSNGRRPSLPVRLGPGFEPPLPEQT